MRKLGETPTILPHQSLQVPGFTGDEEPSERLDTPTLMRYKNPSIRRSPMKNLKFSLLAFILSIPLAARQNRNWDTTSVAQMEERRQFSWHSSSGTREMSLSFSESAEDELAALIEERIAYDGSSIDGVDGLHIDFFSFSTNSRPQIFEYQTWNHDFRIDVVIGLKPQWSEEYSTTRCHLRVNIIELKGVFENPRLTISDCQNPEFIFLQSLLYTTLEGADNAIFELVVEETDAIAVRRTPDNERRFESGQESAQEEVVQEIAEQEDEAPWWKFWRD